MPIQRAFSSSKRDAMATDDLQEPLLNHQQQLHMMESGGGETPNGSNGTSPSTSQHHPHNTITNIPSTPSCDSQASSSACLSPTTSDTNSACSSPSLSTTNKNNSKSPPRLMQQLWASAKHHPDAMAIGGALMAWYLVGVLAICTTKLLLSTPLDQGGVPSPLVLTFQQMCLGSCVLRCFLVLSGRPLQSWPKEPTETSSSLQQSSPTNHSTTTTTSSWFHTMTAAASALDFVLLAGLFNGLDFLASNTSFRQASASFVETIKASEPITTSALAIWWRIDRVGGAMEVTSLGILIAGVLLSTYANAAAGTNNHAEGTNSEVVHQDTTQQELDDTTTTNSSYYSYLDPSLQESIQTCLTVMTANLCFAFRAMAQKLLRSHTPATQLDDFNLLFRMQQTGAASLLIPVLLFQRETLYAVLFQRGDAATLRYYVGLALVNAFSFATYSLASCFILTKLSVVQHSGLGCLRRLFAIVATSIAFGVPMSLLGAMGIMMSVIGFAGFTHYRFQRQGQSKKGDDDDHNNDHSHEHSKDDEERRSMMSSRGSNGSPTASSDGSSSSSSSRIAEVSQQRSWLQRALVLGFLLAPACGFVPPVDDDGDDWEPVHIMRRRLGIEYNYTPGLINAELCRYLSEEDCRNADEALQEHGRKMRQLAQRSPAATTSSSSTEEEFANHDENSESNGSRQLNPSIGAVKVLVLLINFPDHAGSRDLVDPSVYDHMWNGKGKSDIIPSGSISRWFQLNSYGLYEIEANIVPWTEADNTELYYSFGNSGLNLEAQQLFWPALDRLDQSGIDWSQYDIDGDGVLDAVVALHSGYAAELKGEDCSTQRDYLGRIWSHAFATSFDSWTSSDGQYRVGGYVLASAYRDRCGSEPARIGTMTHEFMHTFGLVDVYDGQQARVGRGIGAFDIMASPYGPKDDPAWCGHLSAWSRIAANWLEPIEVLEDGQYSIQASELSNQAYVIRKPYPFMEYLLIENRQPLWFDARLWTGGLVIYHIDDRAPLQTRRGYPGQEGWPRNGDHYQVAVLGADGQYNLERGDNAGDVGDFWLEGMSLGPGNGRVFPNTDAYQFGSIRSTGITIYDIRKDDTIMTFRVSGLTETQAPASPQLPSLSEPGSSGPEVDVTIAESVPTGSGEVQEPSIDQDASFKPVEVGTSFGGGEFIAVAAESQSKSAAASRFSTMATISWVGPVGLICVVNYWR